MIDGLTSATEVVVLTRTYVEYLKNEQAGHDFNLQFEKRFCFFGRGTWSFEIPRN